MRPVFAILVVVLALAAPAVSLAQTPSAPAAAAQPAALTIPGGTGVQVKILDELKSGSRQVGSAVHFQVDKDIAINGTVLIPKGALAYGQVTQNKRAAIFGQGGKLSFSCDYLVLPTGQQVPLAAQPVNNRGHDDRTATIISAVTDNWTDSFNTGGNVKVKKGQEFTVYVDHDTVIAAPAGPQGSTNASTSPAIPIVPAIIGTGKHVIVSLADGSSYYGKVDKFDSGTYTLENSQGTVQIKASQIASVQYPDK